MGRKKNRELGEAGTEGTSQAGSARSLSGEAASSVLASQDSTGVSGGGLDFQPLGKTLPFRGVGCVDRSVLEVFVYEYPRCEVWLETVTEEFTAVCPYSGLPDFARLSIVYVPDRLCVELRSLKYYLLQYRDVGIYYEHLVNRVLEDLVAVVRPRYMKVVADYTPRGGFRTKAVAEWSRRGYVYRGSRS